jgi:hypothetical protein
MKQGTRVEDLQHTFVKNMKRFYLFYNQDAVILHQLGAKLQHPDNNKNIVRQQLGDELETHPIFQIPWRHHVEIFTKCKSVKEGLPSIEEIEVHLRDEN